VHKHQAVGRYTYNVLEERGRVTRYLSYCSIAAEYQGRGHEGESCGVLIIHSIPFRGTTECHPIDGLWQGTFS
jgi:hypothetical protein